MIEKVTIKRSNNPNYQFSDLADGFLISLPKKCTLNDFLIASKVKPNSYGSIIVSRLYHALMVSSVNVKDEYSRYYSKEYENLNQFLFWKYCIPLKISKKVFADLKEGEIVLYNNFLSGCSWTVNAFIDEPTMLKTLNDILKEVREKDYENSK